MVTFRDRRNESVYLMRRKGLLPWAAVFGMAASFQMYSKLSSLGATGDKTKAAIVEWRLMGYWC
jgi:hypothetical protein